MTNSKLTDDRIAALLDCVDMCDDMSVDENADMAKALRELQERRKAEAPGYPETLPCPVFLEPGLKFGKGCKTETLLIALQRRAEYYAGLDAMTPEERAEHDASIEAFKAMLPQPAPVDKEFIPKNLDKALGVVGVALPESKEEFNFQIERWIQRLIDRVIRYADEFKEQPVPVVPDDISGIIERFQYQADHLSEWHHIDEHSCKVNRRDLMTALEFMDSCRAAMLNGGKS